MSKRRKSRAAEAETAPASGSKLDTLTGLLSRPSGATLAQMVEATGWKPNSVRGALAGSLKKGRGLQLTSDGRGAERVYRADAGAAQ